MPGYNFNNYMLTNISKTTISERPEQRMAGYNTRSDTTKMRRLINTLKVRLCNGHNTTCGDGDGDGDGDYYYDHMKETGSNMGSELEKDARCFFGGF